MLIFLPSHFEVALCVAERILASTIALQKDGGGHDPNQRRARGTVNFKGRQLIGEKDPYNYLFPLKKKKKPENSKTTWKEQASNPDRLIFKTLLMKFQHICSALTPPACLHFHGRAPGAPCPPPRPVSFSLGCFIQARWLLGGLSGVSAATPLPPPALSRLPESWASPPGGQVGWGN